MNEFDNHFELDEKDEALLSWFLDAVREQAPKIQTIDSARFSNVLYAKKALERLLAHIGEDAEIVLQFHPTFSMATLTVEIISMDVYKMNLFLDTIRFANTFEFTPLTNGNLRFSMTFANTLRPI